MLNKHSYIHVYYHVKNPRKYTQICCPWNDAKGHNYDEPGTELFRNDRFVGRVGLNLISQHIKRQTNMRYFRLLQTYACKLGTFRS
jgi:hypothetical protein